MGGNIFGDLSQLPQYPQMNSPPKCIDTLQYCNANAAPFAVPRTSNAYSSSHQRFHKIMQLPEHLRRASAAPNLTRPIWCSTSSLGRKCLSCGCRKRPSVIVSIKKVHLKIQQSLTSLYVFSCSVQ